MDKKNFDLTARKRGIRWIIHATWILGIPVLLGMGLLGRYFLEAQGIQVVSWEEGVALFIPIAIMEEVSLLIMSLLIGHACITTFEGEASKLSRYILGVVATSVSVEKQEDYLKLRYTITGACAAMLVFSAARLLASVLDSTGPGGFAEVALMALAFWPITIALGLFLGLFGAAVGGLLGSWIYSLRTKSAGNGP